MAQFLGFPSSSMVGARRLQGDIQAGDGAEGGFQLPFGAGEPGDSPRIRGMKRRRVTVLSITGTILLGAVVVFAWTRGQSRRQREREEQLASLKRQLEHLDSQLQAQAEVCPGPDQRPGALKENGHIRWGDGWGYEPYRPHGADYSGREFAEEFQALITESRRIRAAGESTVSIDGVSRRMVAAPYLRACDILSELRGVLRLNDVQIRGFGDLLIALAERQSALADEGDVESLTESTSPEIRQSMAEFALGALKILSEEQQVRFSRWLGEPVGPGASK